MWFLFTRVCCRFRSWGLVIKLNYCSDFEHKVWSRFWSWSLGKILRLDFSITTHQKLQRCVASHATWNTIYTYWHTATIRRTETCTCVTNLTLRCANNRWCVKRESRLLLMGFRSEIWLLLQWTIVTVTTDDPCVFYSTLCSDTLWLSLKLCQGDISHVFLSWSFGKVEGDTFFRFNINLKN